MARTKRYQQYVWYRSLEGQWCKLPHGPQRRGPMPEDYRLSRLSHQNDKLEAIIGESFDDQNRLILLAKWVGFPPEQATWELQWRFHAAELEAWHQEKIRLHHIEKEVDATSMKGPLDLCRSKKGLYSNRKVPWLYVDPASLAHLFGTSDIKQRMRSEAVAAGISDPGKTQASTARISYWKRKPLYDAHTGRLLGYTFDMQGLNLDHALWK